MRVYRTPLKDILPEWEFEVWPVDTKCDPTEGPIESFQMHCLAGHSENTFFFHGNIIEKSLFFLYTDIFLIEKPFLTQDAVAYCLCHHHPS